MADREDRGLAKLGRQFPDDDSCLAYLWRLRFAPDGEHAECPRCQQSSTFRRYVTADSRRSWTCTRCGQHLHPTAGTVVEKSSTPLRSWFLAAYLVAITPSVTAKRLERELGVSYKTAMRMRNVLRQARTEHDPRLGAMALLLPARSGATPGSTPSTPHAARPGASFPSAPPPRQYAAHNLPAELSSFIGRAAEIASVRGLVERASLVTIVGAGGCGKTRLALQVARQSLDRYPGGIWWVDLAHLRAEESVAVAAVAALGLREQPPRSHLEVLLDRLGDHDTLLVFDNAEHVLDACAPLMEGLLSGCPGLRLLVTSREPVGMTGETVWRVPSLAVPGVTAESSDIAACDAVRLFVDRARSVQPTFALDDATAGPVASICRRLDGIPLAVELAAARVDALSPHQIAGALNDCFRVLGGGNRTALERHRTLRASMDWSHSLLRNDERVMFRRLAAFVDGFSLPAAQHVCVGASLDREAVLDVLSRLVAKSLVTAEAHGVAHRYRLLEPVRQYATQHLLDSEEMVAVRDRHLAFSLDLAEAGAPELERACSAEVLDQFEVERGNLRAALDWCTANGDGATALRLVNALSLFFTTRWYVREGGQAFADALDASDPTASPARARALWGVSHIALAGSDKTMAGEYATAALDMARTLSDVSTAGRALVVLGTSLANRDPLRAREHLDEAVVLARQSGDRWCHGQAARGRGVLLDRAGHAGPGRTAAGSRIRDRPRTGQPHHSGLVLSGHRANRVPRRRPAGSASCRGPLPDPGRRDRRSAVLRMGTGVPGRHRVLDRACRCGPGGDRCRASTDGHVRAVAEHQAAAGHRGGDGDPRDG